MSALRIRDLNRLYEARYGEQLPNNAVGRECVVIAAHHLVMLAGMPLKRLMNWCSSRAPWLTVQEIEEILSSVASRPQTWKADTLAWKLKLTYTDRQALGITTIGAVDVNKRERAAIRKAGAKRRAAASRSAAKLAACAP
jgi:hypothetical protein